MLRKLIAAAISIVAVAGVAIHIWLPAVAIDAVTLTLLAIAVVSWLAPLFKAIELPGGVKVEFAELEKARDEAESAGILVTAPAKPEIRAATAVLSTDDPNLALASLRIELERRLRQIAERNGVVVKQHSVGALLRELQKRELLSHGQSSILADLLPSLNAAVHGASVDPRASAWAREVGSQLLAGLQVPESLDVEKLLTRWRTADGASGFEIGEDLSKAAIQVPREFLRAMTASPREFDQWLRDIQYHTFTLYKSRDALEDELYAAYYERLKQKMLDAMSPYTTDHILGAAAKRVVEAVKSVTMRTIE